MLTDSAQKKIILPNEQGGGKGPTFGVIPNHSAGVTAGIHLTRHALI
jgi:hypothetical protein